MYLESFQGIVPDSLGRVEAFSARYENERVGAYATSHSDYRTSCFERKHDSMRGQSPLNRSRVNNAEQTDTSTTTRVASWPAELSMYRKCEMIWSGT